MGKVGLLAGVGNLPVEFMRAAQATGHDVVVIAVVDDVAAALKTESDAYYEINVAKLDKIIKTLRSEAVTEVTMIGKVTKEILFKGLKFPDLRAVRLLTKLHNRKDDTIMLALVAELAKEGIAVIDQTAYLKPLMPSADKTAADDGRMGRHSFRLRDGESYGQYGYRPDCRSQTESSHGR